MASKKNKNQGLREPHLRKKNSFFTIFSEDNDDSTNGNNVVAAKTGSDDDWANFATEVSISENLERPSDDPVEEKNIC